MDFKAWIAAIAAAVAIVATAWKSAADYGALEQRVTRVEQDRVQDSAELKAIRIIVTRICAQTPGCRD